MPAVVWSLRASQDIEKHYNYLALRNEDAASKAAQAILQAASSLIQNPYKGVIIEEQAGLRKLPVFFGKYGYVIHYAIIADELVILRIYHGSQDRPY